MGWWIPSSLEALQAAESRILASVNFTPRVTDTDVGNGLSIHTIDAGEGKSRIPLVLCHGYGLGAACWINSIGRISQEHHVYAKDWIGCGNSSRPRWSKTGVDENEAFFVETLERWREANGIELMHLCGHSLGGYLSVAYAERYPHRIEKLVLASPAGIPEHPPQFLEAIDTMPMSFRKFFFKSAMYMWGQGYTPGDFVRTAGPYGKRLIDGYTRNRLTGPVDHELLGAYLYHNVCATPGSGDKALPHLLAPGAFAKRPLINRIPSLDPNIKIFFMYGSHDWMDFRNAQRVQLRTREEKTGQRIELLVVPDAGHQLFLDEPVAFDEALLSVLRSPAVGWAGPPPPTLVAVPRTVASSPPLSPGPAGAGGSVEPDVEAVAAPSTP